MFISLPKKKKKGKLLLFILKPTAYIKNRAEMQTSPKRVGKQGKQSITRASRRPIPNRAVDCSWEDKRRELSTDMIGSCARTWTRSGQEWSRKEGEGPENNRIQSCPLRRIRRCPKKERNEIVLPGFIDGSTSIDLITSSYLKATLKVALTLLLISTSNHQWFSNT